MGRLFWKFFLAFWLAQTLTLIGMGTLLWVWQVRQQQVAEQAHVNPPLPRSNADDDEPMLARRPGGTYGILPPPLPLMVSGMVSMVFAALLAWYFMRPIRRLRAAFDQMAHGKLDVRVGTLADGWDELGDLYKDFDQMVKKLQSLMESRSLLLHNVSHEVRSPLARMRVAIDLIQKNPERAVEFVPRLERDTERIDMLIGELLMLERLGSGMASDMNESVDLQELLSDIADDASFEAQPKQCRIELDLPPSPIHIKSRQDMLSRAFENIIRNAIQHSPAGGVIKITAQECRPDCRVVVTDEGRGMPPEELGRIFEPFFRSASNSSDHVGYGLGLPIALRVVQEHGGNIVIQNRPAGGLMVTMTLPMEKRA